MSARHSKDDQATPGRAVTALTWLGGGTVDDLEGRFNAPLIGALVLIGGVVAWLVSAGDSASATDLPLAVVFSAALVFAAVVVVVIRGTVSSARGVATRIAVAVAVGLLIGELSSMLLFGGSISARLQQATATTAATPAVTSATADFDTQRAARKGLDDAVDAARQRRDAAQVVARCEYQPAPSCPQQAITGVAGNGQITQNTQDVLDQNQHELDAALAARDQQAPALDARIAAAEHTVIVARQATIAGADRGFGARWVAMNAYTVDTPVALVLRIVVAACCILLYLLPLVLHTRQDRTLREKHSQSRLRAELEAETAIAVKRAEVRATAEILRAEHQLAAMRTALEADAEINREYHRQRVTDSQTTELPGLAGQVAAFQLSAPPPSVPSAPSSEPLPLEAAVLADLADPPTVLMPVASLEAAGQSAPADNLPVPAQSSGPTIPVLPDLGRVAARLLRPLVPPVIAQVVENSTQQLRSAQKVFEEFEEFTFSFRRISRVTMQDSEQQPAGAPVAAPAVAPGQQSGWDVRDRWTTEALPGVIDHHAALAGSDNPALDRSDDPRQLPEGRRAIER